MITSLITGITGQDGSYLAEHLLEKGHKVYGMVRRSSSFNTGRIDHLYDNPNLKFVFGDLSDSTSINSIIGDVMMKMECFVRIRHIILIRTLGYIGLAHDQLILLNLQNQI